jgi:hypothetical protein
MRFAGPAECPADPAHQAAADVHVWFNRQGGVVARGFREAGYYWMAWPDLATYRFAPGDAAVTAFPIAGAPLDIIWDVYRRTVAPMALQVHGWEALHASAIVSDGGLVAFSAVSETGKSTLAYALRLRGFPQWSDDGVVFRVDDHAFATPLPFQARLRPGSRDLLGHTDTRREFEENSAGEQQFAAPLPIKVIALLNRRTDDSDAVQIRSVPSTEAFTALLIHAHEFDPGDVERRGRMMQTYLELVARVPVYEVSFSSGRARLAGLVDAIISTFSLQLPEPSTAGS